MTVSALVWAGAREIRLLILESLGGSLLLGCLHLIGFWIVDRDNIGKWGLCSAVVDFICRWCCGSLGCSGARFQSMRIILLSLLAGAKRVILLHRHTLSDILEALYCYCKSSQSPPHRPSVLRPIMM